MGSWTAIGWMVLVVMALGVGFLIGALVLHWTGRRQLVGSLQYILDRLRLLESDPSRLRDSEHVLSELLQRTEGEDMADRVIKDVPDTLH